ncbi:protein kinase [bacterium]|nr:protein kinase [bacterium]
MNVKTLQPGQTIMHYKIVESLGEAGMGEVYRAEDQKLRRQVAIKVLSVPVMRDQTARTRLMREAIAASALNHPNIITIYAIEEVNDVSFIVMEFVEGKSLYRILKRGPLQFEQIIDVGAKVADALSAAHSIGLIHRDIKPGNIMITAGGNVKLLDFGLAKCMPNVGQDFSTDPLFASTLTTMGSPVGTINYMSPEQTRGESLDTRTDIFSLGSVLYEAATAKSPFRGASILELFHEIATAETKAPSSIVSTIPQSFDALISRAMAKKPEDRIATAAEFSETLKKLLHSELVHSREPSHEIPTIKQSASATGETIFLVEDNEDNRDMLTRRLKRKGYEVLIAVNGRDALDRIPVERPDLILMDISLPLVDGIEVSRRLKNSDATKDIPIIALTAHAMAGDREKALAAGCDDYDTKPVDFERLLNKVLRSLEKKKAK